ncbi:MAG TPA: fumarylacetoacetate hydrolase family protein [Bordetella sp.]|uniref:fumarylacetoacetate hydrolase family protein n=1 Tax=Bordetella sp. TaxID=28081 RepID=UPI002ED53AE3
MASSLPVAAAQTLPADLYAGTLVGRAWIPEQSGMPAGPAVVALRADGVYDIGAAAPTLADLLESADPVALARQTPGRRIGALDDLLANSAAGPLDRGRPWLLAPCDLQVIKAAGVTFANSMLERVIEERAKGDPAGAARIREHILGNIGNLADIKPGTEQAAALKNLLIRQNLWSQYLEVGIGPDAEIFTKAPVLSALGPGADIGLHPDSDWNNPEPEVVLSVNSRGEVLGAMLGNDVNLRDFEGRSALLLSKAKDNNGSCALGPFLRLFDHTFGLDDVRKEVVHLRVEGEDGFVLEGTSSMDQITRDPLDLVRQTLNAAHQYPDGFVLFLGTLFAPIQDRGAPGAGFTHKDGDLVRIASVRLGALENRVRRSDRIAPWSFGLRALMANLATRGLL